MYVCTVHGMSPLALLKSGSPLFSDARSPLPAVAEAGTLYITITVRKVITEEDAGRDAMML